MYGLKQSRLPPRASSGLIFGGEMGLLMSNLDALVAYHNAYQAYCDVKSELDSTEASVKKKRLEAAITATKGQINTIQLRIDASMARIGELRGSMAEIEYKYDLEVSEFELIKNDSQVTADEVTEARKSMEKLLSSIRNLYRTLIGVIEDVEKAKNEIAALTKKGRNLTKERSDCVAICEKEREEAKARLAAAKAAAENLQKELPETLVRKYVGVVKRHTPPIVSLTLNNQCGGCNMSLPTTLISRLNLGNDIVTCENCGRIIIPQQLG